MNDKNPISGFVLGLGAVLALATRRRLRRRHDGAESLARGRWRDVHGQHVRHDQDGDLGERSRRDSDLHMQSKVVRFLARNAVGPTAEIVLLDADKMYTLNINKKEYTETSFEDFRNQMQKALQGKGDAEEDRKQPRPSTSPSANGSSRNRM